MTKKIVTIILFTCFINTTYAQSEIPTIAQPEDLISLEVATNLRQETMSKNFIAASYAVSKVKGDYWNWLNNKGNSKNTNFMPRFGKGFLRLTKLVTLDWAISSHFNVINHELNGHAAAMPEFNYSINEVSIPFRFFGKGYNYITKPKLTTSSNVAAYVSYNQKSGYSYNNNNLALTGATGLNSSNSMRQNIEKNWFLSKTTHYDQSLLLFQNLFDFFAYTNLTEYGFKSGDMSLYLIGINGNHLQFHDSMLNSSNEKAMIKYSENNFKIKPKDIINSGVVNLLGDPNLYLAFYNVLIKYIINGQPINKYPTIGTKNFNFMPSVGAYLSPWGPQYFGQAYVDVMGKKFSGTYSFGKNNYGDKFNGIGIKYFNAFEINKLRIGVSADYFSQPKLMIGKKLAAGESVNTYAEKGGNGVMLTTTLDYKLPINKMPIYLTSTLGYKTTGFVPGQSFNQAPIISVGLSFDISNQNSLYKNNANTTR